MTKLYITTCFKSLFQLLKNMSEILNIKIEEIEPENIADEIDPDFGKYIYNIFN